ncbi:cytidylyltransferase domain-containing protein [Malaciobacter sp. WC5094]
MNINISIEARMTSSRLPKKVLKPLGDSTVLEVMINRLLKCEYISDIIVATTINKDDDSIVELCKSKNIKYFRGSENNVFERVLQAHQEFNSDIIVELTGDCPFIDPVLVDEAVQVYLNNSYDYVSNSIKSTFPIGMAIQVYSLKALEQISKKDLSDMDKEHVTPEFYTTNKFKTFNIEASEQLYFPELSVTLDTKEDYRLINEIMNYFKNDYFTIEELISYVKSKPSLLEINKEIKRKGLS